MIEFLTMLSCIPDMIIGAFENPKGCLVVVVLVVLVVASASLMTLLTPVEEPKNYGVAVPVQRIEDEPPKERRIVRIVKWLWDRE